MERILFKKIFIETKIKNSAKAKEIINKFPNSEIHIIQRYDDIFGKVRKPYLEKRENLNLYIAEKRGTIVKEAPNAYGLDGAKHYYFINSYNCIYECEYCYLQGFFNSPDIVLFVNWDDIEKSIIDTAKENLGCWFHAGEFSDSLALSNLTGELDKYYKIFSQIPHAKLELRTKSINIKSALRNTPLDNIFYSFSISTDSSTKKVDHKTPSLKHRLSAIKNLLKNGHQVGLHLDPIIWTSNWSDEYLSLIRTMSKEFDLQSVSYISLGVVRFTDDVFYQFKKNYPDSIIFEGELSKSFDNKIRYPKALRFKMLNHVKMILGDHGATPDSIYYCME